jgi:hypothetical protein
VRFDDRGVVVGVTGSTRRARVSACGAVDAAGAGIVEWYVAAEDRWHVPAQESTVRQRRIDGTPVVETRIRVPEGDAVQRVWAVPELGGLTVIEVENASALPFAVAFSGARVLTERPPAAIEIQGIDLPAGAIVMPVGHRTSVRVGLPHSPRPSWTLPALAPAMAVVRGWLTVVHRASRLELPDGALGEALTEARCDLLLAGPDRSDPIGFLLDVAELARLGDDAGAWMPEIVEPIADVARLPGAEVDLALEACIGLAVRARDDRAAGDLDAILKRRHRDGRSASRPPSSFAEIRRGGSVGRFVAELERGVADGGCLLGAGLPSRWLGVNFEVHRVPTGPRSSVSFALRWHGERPALLWEQHGELRPLCAPRLDPTWSSDDRTGEALLAAPPITARRQVAIETAPPGAGFT